MSLAGQPKIPNSTPFVLFLPFMKNHDIKIVLIDWQAFFTSFIVEKVVRMCNFNDLALDTYLGYNIIEINRGICNKSKAIIG